MSFRTTGRAFALAVHSAQTSEPATHAVAEVFSKAISELIDRSLPFPTQEPVINLLVTDPILGHRVDNLPLEVRVKIWACLYEPSTGCLDPDYPWSRHSTLFQGARTATCC